MVTVLGGDTMEDDGLITPEVGIWAKEKYRLMQVYADIFTTSMKNKWDSLVYIDLFAGAGRVKLKENGEIVLASPLLAVNLPIKFSKYIFCDSNEQKIKTLQTRVKTIGVKVDACYIIDDVNAAINDIINSIPVPNGSNKVLTFCFVDPYKLDNLSFTTIEKIANERFTDFLILIPTDMDANRNAAIYFETGNNVVDKFIGLADWRDRWSKLQTPSTNFGIFVLNEFSNHMMNMGYKQNEVHESVLVRNYQKNAPLYRLVFYSRHDLGKSFWAETKKSSNPQTNMFG